MTDLLNPEPIVRIDGSTHGDINRDTERLTIEETVHGLKTLHLSLVAQSAAETEGEEPALYLDGNTIAFGKSIEVALGWRDSSRTVFKGKISAIELEMREATMPLVHVFAEDELMLLRMTRRSRTYLNKSDKDIASELAGLHSLQVDSTAPGPTYEYVQQWNQSDLAFLRERARMIDAELYVRDRKLYFKARNERTSTDVTLVQGNQLLDVTIRADLAHQRTKVKVSGYDDSARDKLESEAGNDAVQAEISGGRTGPRTLEDQFGERVSFRVRETPLKESEASAWARAQQLRRARSFVTAIGTTSGTPDMEVGSKLTLQRVGRTFEGPAYYATRVRHAWSRSVGFRTHFEAERPTLSETGR